jgi:hypothetical protein
MNGLLDSHTPEPIEPEIRKDLDALITEYSSDYSLSELEKSRD